MNQRQEAAADATEIEETGAAAEASRLFAEFFGTFALVLFDPGAKVVASLTGDMSPGAQAFVPGLVVAAMIYSIGQRSGAHINPAVTFAFALRGVFSWARVPGYWVAQIAGAIAAAAMLRLLFGNEEHLGATLPNGAVWVSLVLEMLLTMTLVSVILGTATQHRIVGPNAAIAVGATIIACNLFAKSESGASMNPARSLGPAIVSGAMDNWWVYVAGPIMGAAIAVGIAFIIHGRPKSDEHQAAKGKGPRNR